ncbi:unnamed protein product [Ilex paraguariensis]|uniref:Glycolipid transfer protein domain-containing protein n=1 Tax=Ilex paraguariensis TaxID=185542 RepID=A0ABC8RU62_9AQUA
MVVKGEKVLTKLTESFKELANCVNSPKPRLEVGQFVSACRDMVPFIVYLGMVLKFAAMEFSAKVDALVEGSKPIDTLEDLIDRDIEHKCAKVSCSNSRNLVRVKRSIDMLKIVFEQILNQRGNSLIGPVSRAYEQVFAPYHGWAIRTAAYTAINFVPTMAQVLKKCNENEASARIQMQNYVIASSSVLQYIENLFHSRESGEEVLELV